MAQQQSANGRRLQDAETSMNHQPTPEQIITRARHEVAARRAHEAEHGWSGASRWVWPAFTLAAVALYLAAPAPLPRKLLLAMGGVCGLRPAHSYFAGDIQLPIESRMVGIYGGFSVTLITLLALRRLGERRLGSRLVIGILTLFFASMAFDGINSTLTDLGLPHIYQSTNVTRLVTGLLSGIAIAPVLVWLLGVVATPRRESPTRAVVRSPWELLLPLVLNIGFAALVMSERAAFYYPIALLSVGGVVATMTIAALLAVLSISGMDGRITRPRQVIAPASIALLITFAVLATTAAARWTLIPSL
jgi:uncharacterized membrane protein